MVAGKTYTLTHHIIKGYFSSQDHFLEQDTNLAEKHSLIHFLHKRLDTLKNDQIECFRKFPKIIVQLCKEVLEG